MRNQQTPPYFLPPFRFFFLKYYTPKTAIWQCGMTSMFGAHRFHAHIYTDRSTFSSGLAPRSSFQQRTRLGVISSTIERPQQVLSLFLYIKRSSLSVRSPRHSGLFFRTPKCPYQPSKSPLCPWAHHHVAPASCVGKLMKKIIFRIW